MTVPQHTPTNKLLYARDIPMFKQEVKAYYRKVRDQQPVPASDFKDFLLQESKVAFVSVQHSGGSRDPEILQVVTAVCHFRNTKTSSTRLWRSESSTSSSVATSQRSARAAIPPFRVLQTFNSFF